MEKYEREEFYDLMNFCDVMEIYTQEELFKKIADFEKKKKEKYLIKLSPAIVYFISEKNAILYRKRKKYLMFSIIVFFLFRVTCWDYLVNYSETKRFLRKSRKYFKKFNIFIFSYISNDWNFQECGKCYLVPIFRYRNFFLNYFTYEYFKYITTGLISKKKKSRNLKNYQIMLFKMFFLNFARKLLRYVNLYFSLISKRMHFVFFYLNFYLKKFNVEAYKYKYFKLETMIFPNYRTGYTIKMPKKPSRKKFIVKKKRTYYF